MKAYLILLVILHSLIDAESAVGNCTAIDSARKKRWFCCDNHEEVNGTCSECSVGFESLDGSPCSPCPIEFYGKECANRCNCIKGQKCDHVMGCVTLQQNSTEGVSESTLVQVKYTPTFTEYNVSRLSTFWFQTIQSFKFREKHSTVRSSTGQITTTQKTKAIDIGLNSREIIVYSISAGAFVFVILLCTVFQRRYKQIYGNFKRNQTGNRRMRNISANPLPELPLEDIEDIYEVIDESNMMDHLDNLRENNISLADDNDSYVQPDSNGYLTPYQPDEDVNTINLNDNKSESSASSDPNHQSTMDRESASSSSDMHERRSSYLSLYQPTVHSFTHNLNDSSSSKSETLTTDSGYLNPYQPIVPDNCLHEYKSILVCSDELSSALSDTDIKKMGDKFPNPYQDLKSDSDTHDYKSVNDLSFDNVSINIDMLNDNSLQMSNIQNEEHYMYMK
ncbi:MEGF10_11 [Mytilus coruscus]|uniref:MEGF10_11 n=1 Tax=Mytilus coruscus TaxID=42192 RepID=A0A6J7ZZW1_MYTCO|nr:MEGF10_11 [Mytilus coruscus]